MLLIVLQAVYVLCICYAIVSDFRSLVIPNWIVIVLVSTFAVFAATQLEPTAILIHVAVAVFVLLFFLGFFIAGWIAGGDVKLMTAIALWTGVEHGANFVLLTALLGSALALALLQIKKFGFPVGGGLGNTWLIQRVSVLAETSQCPYGIAIGAAALLSSGGMFHAG
jgi:prepilin peptidase CpaA